MTRILEWIICVLAGAVIVLAIAKTPVHAHYNAQWIQEGNYKNAVGELCCGERDCGELVAGKVVAMPDGFHVNGVFRITVSATGLTTDEEVHEVVPYSEATPSPDGVYWRCRWGGQRKCFFAPPPGS